MNATSMASSPTVAPAPRLDLLAVALLGVMLFLPFLGRRDFWSSREARVAQVARQMRASREVRGWIVPRLGGEERLKKPPLAYWLAALASTPWPDVDEFNSRLPNAAAGIGALVVIYLFGLRLYGRSVGLLASLMLATTPDIWLEARTTGIEFPLLLFNLLALYAWWRYREDVLLVSAANAQPGMQWLLLCYFAAGLSFLQKGPVGPTVILLIAVAYGWIGDRTYFVWRAHLAGLAVFCLLALPWPLAVLASDSGAWEIWHQEFFGRLKGRDHIEPWYYFASVVFSQGQPWAVLALLGIWQISRFSHGDLPALVGGIATNRQHLLPVIWATVVFVFFSVPASKQSYYILLIYPALALLAAALVQMAEEKFAYARSLIVWYLRVAACLIMAAGVVLVILALSRSYPEHIAWLKRLALLDELRAPWRTCAWRAAIPLFLLGAGMLWVVRRRPSLAAGFLAAAVSAGFAVFVALVPAMNRHKSDRFLCQRLMPFLAAGDRIFNYATPGVPTLTYYLGQEVERLEKPSQIMAAMAQAGKGRAWFLLEDDDWRDLAGIAVVRAIGSRAEDKRLLDHRFSQARAALQAEKSCAVLGVGQGPWQNGPCPLADDPQHVVSEQWLLLAVADKGDANTRLPMSIAEERRIIAAALRGLPVWWRPLAWHLQPHPGQCLHGKAFWAQGLILALDDLAASDRFRDLEGDTR